VVEEVRTCFMCCGYCGTLMKYCGANGGFTVHNRFVHWHKGRSSRCTRSGFGCMSCDVNCFEHNCGMVLDRAAGSDGDGHL
jgi:hypothetical protein